MSNFTTREYTLHSHFASALINGDLTSFSDEELEEFELVHDWLREELGGQVHCVDAEDVGFRYSNDYDDVGGDMCTYTFHVHDN